MKRKFWNWVRNEGERTLFLNGEISDETWYGDEVTPKLFKDELLSGKCCSRRQFIIRVKKSMNTNREGLKKQNIRNIRIRKLLDM